jgi:hypothetical protein
MSVAESLGPLLTFVPLESPVAGRLYSGALAAGLGAVLLVAIGLEPDPRGMGTHEGLGLPPCGFVTITGLPCPTCGMTTAFSHAVRGELLQALRVQLAGLVAAIGTVLAFVCAVGAVVTGKRPSLNWYRLQPMYFVWAGMLLMVGAWAFKIFVGLADGSLPAR